MGEQLEAAFAWWRFDRYQQNITTELHSDRNKQTDLDMQSSKDKQKKKNRYKKCHHH